MTKPAFDVAEMIGKLDRVGVVNPTLRQGIGFGMSRGFWNG